MKRKDSKQTVKPAVEPPSIDPVKAKAEIERDKKQRIESFHKAIQQAAAQYNCELAAKVETVEIASGVWGNIGVPILRVKD